MDKEVKVYETQEHLDIGKVVLQQYNFVHKYIRMNNDGDIISDHSGDALVKIMMYLTAFYEGLSKWLADQHAYVVDTKAAYDFAYSDAYLRFKAQPNETNETARHRAKMYCKDEETAKDNASKDYKRVEAWKKSVGRYHDAVRSQLSYEKTIGGMSR